MAETQHDYGRLPNDVKAAFRECVELRERIHTLESACEAALKMVEEDVNHVLQFQRILPERVCAVRDQLRKALKTRGGN